MSKLLPGPRKSRGTRLGLAAVAALLAALLMLGTFSTIVRAQTDTQTTPNPTENQGTTENSGATAVPTFNPDEVTEADLEGIDIADNGDHLTADELAQIKQLRSGLLSEEQVDQLKVLASEQLAKFGPLAIKKLEAKSEKKQETRLFWIAMVIVVGIPLLALLGFLAYPLIIRKSIKRRAPNATLKQVYGLYLPQALMVTLVLLVLGGSLWGVQLLTGRVLGGVTNPQLVFQKQAIQYVIDDRDELINNYSDIMLGLARDITDGDPEKPLMDIILDNALQLKDDPLVNAANNIIQFVMPFLNYISLISFGLLLLFFLLRIRPDIMHMLKYPIDILEAEEQHRTLPEFDSVGVGVIQPGQNSSQTMRIVGRKLMWNEVKVMVVFAIILLAFATVLSLALILFFQPIVGWVVDAITTAAEYFLYSDDGANLLVWASIVLMLFLVECIVLFLVAFIFVLQRLQGVIRMRFAGTLTSQQALTYVRGVALRFLWVMAVVAILGMGLPFLAGFVDDQLYNKGHDPSWLLILLAVPAVLIIGLNLGMWLLQGFKNLARILTVTPARVFNLTKDKPKKSDPVPA
ncbi:MAG: hypothetical protein J0I20_18730 [Chloroflexi bacterium]|nr:hypothetical protein [Chloroflexota bacterium]